MNQIYGIIYIVVNKLNSKKYIGQTTNELDKRIKKHQEKIITYFHTAIKKYGIDNFEWYQIDKALNQKELNTKEKNWIRYYQSNNRKLGYNCTDGGYNGKPNKEIRKKLSERQLGAKNHAWKGGKEEYYCILCSKKIYDYKERKYCSRKCVIKSQSGKGNPFYGKVHTDETKQKISKGNMGKIRTKELKEFYSKTRKGKNHPRYGKKHSEESKRKMRNSALMRYAKEKTIKLKEN